MKRFSLLLVLSLAILFSLHAVDIVIAPYNAFSGVPVGNSYYHGTGTGGWIDYKWKTSGNGKGGSISDGTEKNYTDEEMVGLVSIQSNFEFAGSITITASAPNGLYMASQQEPSYKRPIEIWFFPSYYFYGTQRLYTTDYIKELSNDSPSATWFAKIDDCPSGLVNKTIKSFWFDVVLVLPGKLNPETNEIEVTENEKTIYYPLVTADDYSSVVTITVTYTPWNGSAATTQTLTIPFTGYYDSSLGSDQVIKASSVSMNVTLESTAYNMNLKNQGTLIDIGELSYLAQNSKSLVFFSSSSDPTINGGEFEFVKTGLGVNTKHTAENSLGFKIRVSTPEGSTLYSTNSYIDYDGTTYITDALKNSTADDRSLASAGFIIPVEETYSLEWQKTKKKYVYSSRIYVILDNADGLLLAGRYTAEVYVHVMTYQ